MVHITWESGSPREKVCGIGNIQKSALKAKVELSRGQILHLTVNNNNNNNNNNKMQTMPTV
jgi:hypothetical protein